MADFSRGWVKILRSIQDHKFWQEKPFTKGQAWIDLILTANHKDNQILKGNTLIDVKRGQLLTSQLQLSYKWGWSRHKVRNFLTTGVNLRMVCLETNIQKDNGFTLITILNYNGIQENKETERTTKRTTKGQQKDNKLHTNNNDNNEKNEIKDTIVSCQQHFYSAYKEYTKEPYVPNYPKDGAIFKRLRACLTDEQINTLIDNFFKSNDDFIKQAGFTVGVFYTQVNKLRKVEKTGLAKWEFKPPTRPDPKMQEAVANLIHATKDKIGLK